MKDLQPLRFDQVREAYPDRWRKGDPRKALSMEGGVSGDGPGVWIVQHPDSFDSHVVELARAYGGFVGFCGCTGFEHHDGPCSHLIMVKRIADMADNWSIPEIEVQYVSGEPRDDVRADHFAEPELTRLDESEESA